MWNTACEYTQYKNPIYFSAVWTVSAAGQYLCNHIFFGYMQASLQQVKIYATWPCKRSTHELNHKSSSDPHPEPIRDMKRGKI